MSLINRNTGIPCLVAIVLVLSSCETDPALVDPYSLYSWERYSAATGLSSNQISALKCDSKGNLWVGTLGDGIMKFDGETWTFLDTLDGLGDITVLSIEEDPLGQIWFGTLVGFSVYNDSFFVNFTFESEVMIVHDIHRAMNDVMWLATEPKGLHKVKAYNDVTVYNLEYKPGTDTVYCIEEDSRGRIWAGTEDGVFKITGSRVDFIQSGNGIPQEAVKSILADSWGNIWFGSRGNKNVVRLRDNVYEEISLQNNKSANVVYDILEAPNRDIWFGLANGGAVRFNGSNMQTFRNVDGSPGTSIFCLEVDKNGHLWFGSFLNGLSVYRPGPADIIPPIE